MNETLEKLINVNSDGCVTVLLKTHVSFPDSDRDILTLKNLVKDAETKLLANYDKQLATFIIDKMNNLVETIDFRHNSESLVLFVNENIAEYIRLPVTVKNRVVVDKTFATRDLTRAIQRAFSYYILILSRDKARLIEALNGEVTREIGNGFRVENRYTVPGAEGSLPFNQDNLAREFFSQVDRQLNEEQKQNPIPVIICTDESNYAEYLSISNHKEMIVGHLTGNRDHQKAHQVIEEVWPLAKQFSMQRNRQRLTELSAALETGTLETSINDIWRAIKEGRGQTLFVKQGYFLPATVENDGVSLPPPQNVSKTNVNDIIDEMIEKNIELGGDTVFIDGDELDQYDGLILVTRY